MQYIAYRDPDPKKSNPSPLQRLLIPGKIGHFLRPDFTAVPEERGALFLFAPSVAKGRWISLQTSDAPVPEGCQSLPESSRLSVCSERN
jgi:hypothetical protein